MKAILSVKKLLLFFVLILSGCVSTADLPENSKSSNTVLSEQLASLQQQQALLDGRDFYYPFLGLKMTLPETWSLKLANSSNLSVASGSEPVTLNGKVSGRSVALLHLTGLDGGKLSSLNLTLVVSDLKRASALKKLDNKELMKAFNFGMRLALKKEKIPYSFNREVYFKNLGNVEYNIFPADIHVAGTALFQDYYSIYVKEKILTFILTYENSFGLKQLEKLIKEAVIADKDSTAISL